MNRTKHPYYAEEANEPIRLLSIVIPVYNEEGNIEKVFQALDKVEWPMKTEWIIVEDGSTDYSRSVIKQNLSKYPHARLIMQEPNQGKAAAIDKGIFAAKGQIIVIQDADLEYDPKDILKLIQPIQKNEADVVYGSRYLDYKEPYSFHTFVNNFLTFLSNAFSGLKLTDMETCYKVFKAPLLKSFRIQTKRFGFEPEVTAYIAKFDLKVKELPVNYAPRNYHEGKKIGWKDGVAALWFLVKFNFFVSAHECVRKKPSKADKTDPQSIAS